MRRGVLVPRRASRGAPASTRAKSFHASIEVPGQLHPKKNSRHHAARFLKTAIAKRSAWSGEWLMPGASGARRLRARSPAGAAPRYSAAP